MIDITNTQRISKQEGEVEVADADDSLNPSSTKGVMNPMDDEVMLDVNVDKSIKNICTI